MAQKKKKITKKEIKEDKLVTYFFETREFLEKYQKQLLIGAAALIVIIVAGILIHNKSVENERTASSELSAIVVSYANFNWQTALNGDSLQAKPGLLKIADEYGSTTPGEIAKLLAGNAYYGLDEIDLANKYYSDYGGSLNLFDAASVAGQSACFEANKNYGQAAEFYQLATKKDRYNPLNAEYMMRAAYNYILIGKYGVAEELLNKVQRDYPRERAARDVERYRGLIEAKRIEG